MNIAFYNKELPSDRPNGVSCQVHRLANALVSLGHTVTCFSFSRQPDDALYQVRQISPLPLLPGPLKKFAAAIAFASVSKKGFDICHFHGDDFLIKGGSRRVRTFYGSAFDEALFAKKLSRCLYQALFYLFEVISCFKRGRRVGISKISGRALPLPLTVIPCGVPRDRYYPQGTKSDHPAILFLGDLNSRKQGSLMMDVFKKEILPLLPSAELVIVGPQPCSAPGVRYAGVLGETALIAEYRRAWVLCMASSYEGFGVPVIEAQACGTAVVCVSNPGIADIVRHGENGLLCTVATLGATVMRILTDDNLRSHLCASGKASVALYDILNVARAYENIYQSQLNYKK